MNLLLLPDDILTYIFDLVNKDKKDIKVNNKIFNVCLKKFNNRYDYDIILLVKQYKIYDLLKIFNYIDRDYYDFIYFIDDINKIYKYKKTNHDIINIINNQLIFLYEH